MNRTKALAFFGLASPAFMIPVFALNIHPIWQYVFAALLPTVWLVAVIRHMRRSGREALRLLLVVPVAYVWVILALTLCVAVVVGCREPMSCRF